MVLQSLLLTCICIQFLRMCLSLAPVDYIDKLNKDHWMLDPDWYSNMYPVLIQKRISVKVNIVSCITVGPPTVGKTTFKKQLLLPDNISLRLSKRPPSTPTIDRVKKVGIRLQQSNAKNQANQFIANNGTWKSLTKVEEFIAVIASIAVGEIFAIEKRNSAKLCENKMIPGHCFLINFFVCLCTAPTWVASVLNNFIGTSSTGIMASTSFLFCIIAISVVTAALIVIAISCCYAFCKRLVHKEENLVLQALKNKNTVKLQKFFHGNLIIHFRDTGGQPEFHEVVPALVPHSNLYLLMFNLNEDLNKQYKVTYKASEDDITDPYQSSFTVKQTLLQLLVSIQSLNHSSQGIPSNAFIIGTHKDLLVNEETRINQIQQELEEEIKGTDWYTSDTIITTLDGQLMLPINTHNKNDIDQVKNAISKSIAVQQISVPIQWLALYFHIEKMNKSVMHINEFKNLAHRCNIDDENEFDAVVTFLQSTLGSIRYFGNVLEMKDIVITDPQILFDLVSELIVCTFNFKNLRTVGSRHQTERFRSSGHFKRQSLKRCEVVKNGLLTEDQVISILQHLNIIAPVGINDKGEEEYFLPCVLVHAPVSTQPASINTTGYSPLLITFKCGYIPRGVFSCLISSILCAKSQWVLASEKIYRNQVKLYGRNCGHFVFIRNYIKYLEVTIMLCQGSTIINVPFAEIKELLSDHLTCVIQKLGYSFKDTQFLFSFYCSCGSQSHPAVSVPNANPPHTKCTFDPSLTTTMTPDKTIWFQGKYDSTF